MKDQSKAISSLNYLFNNLSSLPWSSITPDKLKINYLPLTAIAKFHDKSVSKKLFSKDKELKHFSLIFDPEGISISEKIPGEKQPRYLIKFNLEPVKGNKIKLLPNKLEFNGVTVPQKTIKKLIENYTLDFEIPEIPYNLRIISISTVAGKLILKLKK